MKTTTQVKIWEAQASFWEIGWLKTLTVISPVACFVFGFVSNGVEGGLVMTIPPAVVLLELWLFHYFNMSIEIKPSPKMVKKILLFNCLQALKRLKRVAVTGPAIRDVRELEVELEAYINLVVEKTNRISRCRQEIQNQIRKLQLTGADCDEQVKALKILEGADAKLWDGLRKFYWDLDRSAAVLECAERPVNEILAEASIPVGVENVVKPLEKELASIHSSLLATMNEISRTEKEISR